MKTKQRIIENMPKWTKYANKSNRKCDANVDTSNHHKL